MCNFWILIFCSLTTVAFVTADCSIDLRADIQLHSPVILVPTIRNSYKLFKPTGNETTIRTGTRLLLACPTDGLNEFENRNTNVIRAICSNGNFRDLRTNTILNLNQLLCKLAPISTLQNTFIACSDRRGFLYQTGFSINKEFYGPVFEICYNTKTTHTLYTHNTLNGAAMSGAVSTRNFRRDFTADGMNFSTSTMDSFYGNQTIRFNSLFGINQDYVNLNKSRFLARGHLSADADFIFPYEKLATYFYVNTAPEFQKVNIGNWKRVEELARNVSKVYSDNIESYNGYLDVLELPKDPKKPSSNTVKIYLADVEKILVPKFFYKVLIHKASDSAIVFVTVNNPYLDSRLAPVQEFCGNVCLKSGISHRNFPDVTKGYTFCCELNSFKSKVNWVLPAEVKGNKLLTI